MKLQFLAAFLSAVIALPMIGAVLSLPSLAQTPHAASAQDLSVLQQGYLRPRGHQSYEFRGEANQTATIALTSREFDTYLELYDIEGRRVGDRHTNYLFRGETLQHTFEATAGDAVTLLLESNQFDPYLTLYGPDGLLIAENDDADNTNSRITLQLP
jgi:hypothetical protein